MKTTQAFFIFSEERKMKENNKYSSFIDGKEYTSIVVMDRVTEITYGGNDDFVVVAHYNNLKPVGMFDADTSELDITYEQH